MGEGGEGVMCTPIVCWLMRLYRHAVCGVVGATNLIAGCFHCFPSAARSVTHNAITYVQLSI